MNLTDILTPTTCYTDIHAESKKRTLEIISEIAARQSVELNATLIFSQLVSRERLGSTALGHGVALPHCRLPGLEHTLGVLLHLRKGLNFDAPDNEAVDLVLALLVPENSSEEHLQLLATIAELFKQSAFRQQLRAAKDDQSLYQAAIHYDEQRSR